MNTNPLLAPLPWYQRLTDLSYVWQVLAKGTFPDNQLELIHHLQRRIFFCTQQIWFVVKHVLCDDSPEGHLPEKMEDIEGLDTKDLLSYSFRAVHESRYGRSPRNTTAVTDQAKATSCASWWERSG